MLVLAERRHYNYTAFRGCGWVCKCPDVQNGCTLRGGQSIAVHADFKGGCPEPCNETLTFLTQAQNAYVHHYNKARSEHIHDFMKSQQLNERERRQVLGDAQGANSSGRRRRIQRRRRTSPLGESSGIRTQGPTRRRRRIFATGRRRRQHDAKCKSRDAWAKLLTYRPSW